MDELPIGCWPPQTLDDAISLIRGLRRVRGLTADWVRIILDRQKGECTWCGDLVSKGKKTWCSPKCVDEFQKRCDSSHQARLVIERDKGICQICGFNTKEAKAPHQEEYAKLRSRKLREQQDHSMQWRRTHEGRTAPHIINKDWRESKEYLAIQDAYEVIDEKYHFARGRFHEVDHIVPVVEGGGLCTIDNLRLLCGTCHNQETKKLAKRRTKKK